MTWQDLCTKQVIGVIKLVRRLCRATSSDCPWSSVRTAAPEQRQEGERLAQSLPPACRSAMACANLALISGSLFGLVAMLEMTPILLPCTTQHASHCLYKHFWPILVELTYQNGTIHLLHHVQDLCKHCSFHTELHQAMCVESCSVFNMQMSAARGIDFSICSRSNTVIVLFTLLIHPRHMLTHTWRPLALRNWV